MRDIGKKTYMTEHFFRFKPDGEIESVVRLSDGYENVLKMPKIINAKNRKPCLTEIGVMEIRKDCE